MEYQLRHFDFKILTRCTFVHNRARLTANLESSLTVTSQREIDKISLAIIRPRELCNSIDFGQMEVGGRQVLHQRCVAL